MHGPQGDALEAQNERLKLRMGNIRHKILVMSGKGGVGKTTVAVNLAIALAMKGWRIGLLDTDLHGPNIAKMLGVSGGRLYSSDENTIEPFELPPLGAGGAGIRMISLALSGHGDDEPIIWRGPIKISVIKQFLADVNWGELDCLVIDSPPGTGDEPLTVVQSLPGLSGCVVVTTPQEVAVLDSRKSINFAHRAQARMLGVIENMCGFVCPHCGEMTALFGQGGGERAAADMGVPFLGSVPIDPELMTAEDRGSLYLKDFPESAAAKALLGAADALIAALSAG